MSNKSYVVLHYIDWFSYQGNSRVSKKLKFSYISGTYNVSSLDCEQMGIPGLTRYVDTLPVWESFDLYDTKLVIDGCGLYYYIYANSARLNTKYGGQYDQFRSEVKGFFAKLQMSKVIPYVVIDGIMNRDEKKFKTHVKRKTDIINRMRNMWTRNSYTYEMVLPRLVQLVFVQVLREIKIPYAIADL